MTTIAADLPEVVLDAASSEPLHRQLYGAVRHVILEGRLPPGTRLPATRDLARQLGVSRNTVMAAFEQLTAEGYLEGRVGAGTYVSAALPDDLLHARPAPAGANGARRPQRALSRRGRMLAATRVTTADRAAAGPPRGAAFRLGTPDTSLFPFEEWARIVARLWREPPVEMLRYGDPAGYAPLRQSIAAHAGVARAVRCTPDQVIVVSGSQQALDLAARVLLDPDDAVVMEDPGYLGARAALTAAGARIVPCAVDAEGLDVAHVRNVAARAVYVTPSHQFPLGVTMGLARRLALLEWAAERDAWVFEDDYDSEYRYAGRPHAALQGLDADGRVIYIGTFSKVLFPALRVGYLIVPAGLSEAFVAARAIADRHPPTVDQAALAEFIDRGLLARHIRRMRGLYAERQALLLELSRRLLRGQLDVTPCNTGMHVAGWLPDGVDDVEASRRAAQLGIDAAPLSHYRLVPGGHGALLLGYSAVAAREMAAGVSLLGQALAPLTPRRS